MKSVKPTQPEAAQVQDIFLEQLVPSRFEARKTIEPAALAELAESIRAKGVLEPLIVRPVPELSANEDPRFEIGAGQRRWQASKLAGKTTVPCLVRLLSDDELRELGIISNLQRQDLEPIDEAEAYGKLLELPGATMETVAAKVAKSPSYVGRRVQLLKAIEPVRLALKAGAVEVGHAMELARLTEATQRELLTWLNVGAAVLEPEDIEDDSEVDGGECRYCGCTEDDACEGGCSWANAEQTICTNLDCIEAFRAEVAGQTLEGGEPEWRKTHFSLVDLKQQIARVTLRVLSDAPFPLTADLAPMPCTDCPKRSGNAALLFDDCAQDTCTDRKCFDAKVEAWTAGELEKAKGEKRKLLKLTPQWTREKDVIQCGDYQDARVLKAEGDCAHGEEGIWVGGENIGRRALICRNKNCKKHFGATRSSYSSSSSREQQTPAQKEKAKAERREVLDKVKAETAYRQALVTAAGARNVDAKIAEELQIDVCAALIAQTSSMYAAKFAKALGWDEALVGWNGRKKLREKIASLPAGQRLIIARLSEHAGELSVSEYNVAGKCEDLEKIARLAGVDLKALRVGSGPAGEAKPKAVAKKPAKKAAAKKGVLSAEAKKRIAAAQKRRWATAAKAAKKGGRK